MSSCYITCRNTPVKNSLTLTGEYRKKAAIEKKPSISAVIDYCNAVLHGAPNYSIKELQWVQNNAARIVLQEPTRSHATPLLKMLYWLPVQQRIEYKVVLLTFKVHSTLTPLYLRRLIKDWTGARSQPTICHHVVVSTIAEDNVLTVKRAFRCSVPAIWNSLPKTVIDSDSVTFLPERDYVTFGSLLPPICL